MTTAEAVRQTGRRPVIPQGRHGHVHGYARVDDTGQVVTAGGT